MCRYGLWPYYLVCVSVCLSLPLPRPCSVGTPIPVLSDCLSPPCPTPRPGSVGTPVPIPSVCLSVPLPVLVLSVPQYVFRLSVCLSPPAPHSSVPTPAVVVLSEPQYLFCLSVCWNPLSPSPETLHSCCIVLPLCLGLTCTWYKFFAISRPYTPKVLRYKRVRVGLYPSPPNQIMYRLPAVRSTSYIMNYVTVMTDARHLSGRGTNCCPGR